jgi:alcohol dehydrogenase
MDAVIFDGTLRLDTDYPTPTRPAGEALIKPHLVGICNTDIEITRGYMGFQGVLGHEFVGTVQESDDPEWVGKRVVGEINAACRRCPACLRGDESHCPNRTTLGIDRRDGAMAEAFTLPESCLYPVPESVSDEQAVFVEPLAAALEIVQQSHIRPTDRVAVIGDGKLGALIVQVLRLTGCDLTLLGHHPERWDLFRRQAITCMHSDDAPDPTFDVVVECTGQPGGLATARRLIRPRGRMVLKSTFNADTDLNLTMVVVDEVQLVGSRCGPFAPALRLLERNLVEVEPLISARFALREAEHAFETTRGNMKVLLK